jgi:3-oxoacyl-[acyl-carrier-protein] synthase-1/3-oxoacyl-[acyl-carrier-protein] synthase II
MRTATRAPDAMTERVPPVVHAFKAQIGHTLGAAGVLETLAAADALERGVAPATAGGEGAALDPDAPAEVLDRAEARALGPALKLSAAFGGSDAALVLAPPSAPSGRPRRHRRAVGVGAWARVVDADLVALAAATGIARDRLARLDGLCRLGLAAVAALARGLSHGNDALRGAGIVAGQALATLDTNDAYATQLRARGPTLAPPRVFPATSPNAIVGECAIAFRLTGPSFAVGAGLDAGMEALAAARELCAAGDADRIVVVVADDAGDASRELLRAMRLSHRELARGAVALLLGPFDGGREVPIDLAPSHDGGGAIGHLSVLGWLGG